jgi:hypothetical protein
MGYGTWNVRSLYGSGSLKTVEVVDWIHLDLSGGLLVNAVMDLQGSIKVQ